MSLLNNKYLQGKAPQLDLGPDLPQYDSGSMQPMYDAGGGYPTATDPRLSQTTPHQMLNQQAMDMMQQGNFYHPYGQAGYNDPLGGAIPQLSQNDFYNKAAWQAQTQQQAQNFLNQQIMNYTKPQTKASQYGERALSAMQGLGSVAAGLFGPVGSSKGMVDYLKASQEAAKERWAQKQSEAKSSMEGMKFITDLLQSSGKIGTDQIKDILAANKAQQEMFNMQATRQKAESERRGQELKNVTESYAPLTEVNKASKEAAAASESAAGYTKNMAQAEEAKQTAKLRKGQTDTETEQLNTQKATTQKQLAEIQSTTATTAATQALTGQRNAGTDYIKSKTTNTDAKTMALGANGEIGVKFIKSLKPGMVDHPKAKSAIQKLKDNGQYNEENLARLANILNGIHEKENAKGKSGKPTPPRNFVRQ